MKLYGYFLCSIMLCASATLCLAEQYNEELDLRRIAEDQKFENARYLYDMKLYERSLQEMNEYLEIYIHGAHRKDAYLAIASIYLKKFDYQKAVKSYTGLYEEFSHTEEGLEAYMKSAVCYHKMGQLKKAKEIYSTIAEDYPETQQASLARTQLQLLEILSFK